MPILEPSGFRSTFRWLISVAHAVFYRRRVSHHSGNTQPPDHSIGMLHHRLLDGSACLASLDAERERRSDPGYGRAVEDRIIWTELLELELQEIDEQMDRILHQRGGARGDSRS